MNSPPHDILRTLAAPAHRLKALPELLREPLEPFRATRQQPFTDIAAYVVQKCVLRHGGRTAQRAVALFVAVREDFFSGWEVFWVNTVEDDYAWESSTANCSMCYHGV
jgi:hypothetical protein